MEAFSRTPLGSLPEPQKSKLKTLEENWEEWGKEFEAFHLSKGKDPREGQDFSWREGIYPFLRDALKADTCGHCSFCDADHIAGTSKETIEHYYPKEPYRLRAYQYENLYYACDKCQAKANATKTFVVTLRPDEHGYAFERYFYYSPIDGEIKVWEDIPDTEKTAAALFLERYGINHSDTDRSFLRKRTYDYVVDRYRSRGEVGERDDWPYRFVFDAAMTNL